jgi:hypothetical protein
VGSGGALYEVYMLGDINTVALEDIVNGGLGGLAVGSAVRQLATRLLDVACPGLLYSTGKG